MAGVLVAGSAAALVNTQVLGSNNASNSGSPFVVDDVAQVRQTVPTVTVASPVRTPAVASLPAATRAVYAVGDAGTVTLDTAGDRLTIVAVAPAVGWTVTKSEADDANNVEVTLQSGTTDLEFHANMQFGVVTPSVETHDESATASSIDDSGSGRNGGDDESDDRGGDDD